MQAMEKIVLAEKNTHPPPAYVPANFSNCSKTSIQTHIKVFKMFKMFKKVSTNTHKTFQNVQNIHLKRFMCVCTNFLLFKV